MRHVIGSAALVVGSFFLGTRQAQEQAAEAPPPVEAFRTEALRAELEELGRPWRGFLERPSLSCGLYRLEQGATDGQSPHRDDEVYYVIEGRAQLTAGDEELEAEPGSIFYVARDIPHRFHDITEDLLVLVFFARTP